MIELPSAFLNRMQKLLGSEYEGFRASYEREPVSGLRVNTLKISPEIFQSISPYPLSHVPWCSSGFFIEQGENDKETRPPGKHPYHAAGLYYLQDPSAMATAETLAPRPGERILDLSAAPGGKATHLATLMRNEGLLVANEIHPKRAWDLAENMERWGAKNAAILNEQPGKLADTFGAVFDRVLLDAPCSGEGMFRRSETARSEWSPGLIRSCSLRQSSILAEAARMVRPGGSLAYTTCTFATEENEAVVARFLDEHPEYCLVEAPRHSGFQPGREDWAGEDVSHPDLQKTVRLWPHHLHGEGHFIALMQRSENEEFYEPRSSRKTRLPEPVLRQFRFFWGENIKTQPPGGNLEMVGSYLYLIPDLLPETKGLKTIHPGWWLGTIKKDRFEPSHALAMSTNGSEARRTVDLSTNDESLHTALTYLRGESFLSEGDEGWTLVTLDSYPLGWGKRVKGVVKNWYPKGLRWM
jgi:NOL1/NOP2/sun family putative RNA methylase